MLKNQIQNQTRKKNNKAEKNKLLNGFPISKNINLVKNRTSIKPPF